MLVFLETMFSVSAARAVINLMVEQGMNPLASPSLWFTMVRMRPFDGSTTTTLPGMVPRASAAARRTVRSSPSTLSPLVGSTGGGSFRSGFRAVLRAGFLVALAARVPALLIKPATSRRARNSLFIHGAIEAAWPFASRLRDYTDTIVHYGGCG